MALTMLAGLPVEVAANTLGVLAGVGILALVWRLGFEASPKSRILWLAPLALAGNRSFAAWSTGGLETQFYALLVFAGVTCFLLERSGRFASPLASALLFALASLTRPDGVIFAAIAGVAFLADVAFRRRSIRDLVLWVGILGMIIAALRLRHATDFLLLAIVATWSLYLYCVGGDRFEYRHRCDRGWRPALLLSIDDDRCSRPK
jgi:4-amino-4-deoxy-L-arabinose transferase-like glycosyltransferase